MAAPAGFARLSRFWQTADGWLRTHANYPWHRDSLLDALGEPDDVEAAMSRERAADLAERIVAAGGVAAAVRTESEWLATPAGQAVAAAPLIEAVRTGDAEPRRRGAGPLPASGLRVLDLTRVIAGPVCTRFLAALGADVLRLDPPHRPELPGSEDSLLGKRSAVLDARTAVGHARLHELLGAADVLVHGYRPGTLDAFGLSPADLAERHPGLVTVSLSAWGTTGPWGERRGFDSIVQAASGIAMAESADERTPGAMPCQLLDHGTGYLCAAAALDGVRRQRAEGGTLHRRLSLARTAHWLLGQPRPAHAVPSAAPEGDRWLTPVDARITAVSPPGTLDGHGLSWPRPPGYGTAEPRW
ncbi:carnitine dehydratase [Amycolatopsis suaedae]|uniref:Carnitine dehydratase n=2 Tax=Amycolatopsis suaedae TaxID=2510978 RepID=A0A4V2ELK4_9PSEU|nr:carnitine dehydratase [Amycolatopsis suaedae]